MHTRNNSRVRALILTHAPHEHAGLVGHALAGEIDTRALYRGDPVPTSAAAYDLVVAMGGPMSAWDDAAHPFLAAEARLLAGAARAGACVLGICLGAQLLARGLGARVYRNRARELGIAPIALTDDGRADPLLAPLDGADVLHWHDDTFDLPAGAVRLASTELTPNQAFRFGARAWGVQFHVECDTAMIRAWSEMEPDLARGTHDLAWYDQRGTAFARALIGLASRTPLK